MCQIKSGHSFMFQNFTTFKKDTPRMLWPVSLPQAVQWRSFRLASSLNGSIRNAMKGTCLLFRNKENLKKQQVSIKKPLQQRIALITLSQQMSLEDSPMPWKIKVPMSITLRKYLKTRFHRPNPATALKTSTSLQCVPRLMRVRSQTSTIRLSLWRNRTRN